MKPAFSRSVTSPGALGLAFVFSLAVFISGCKPKDRPKGSTRGKAGSRSEAATGPRKTPPDESVKIDCDLLSMAIRRCSLHVVAAGDPTLGQNLGRLPKTVRSRVIKGIRAGLSFRVVAPCKQHRGTMPQSREVAECLALYKKALNRPAPRSAPRPAPRKGAKGARPAPAPNKPGPCKIFSTCLAKIFPPPKEARKKTPPTSRPQADGRKPAGKTPRKTAP